MIITSHCTLCHGQVVWQECPQGGWWIHVRHPSDDHDAVVPWKPEEDEDHNGMTFTVEPMRKVLLP